ncbi:uncharacterized protein LOC131317047 [Rhododendron vialii]|uniref:uncharacterized protein LOC131317047 n=1 Tax=Rhododendron vialii TaxID=182163 RepID=UPI00265FFF0E|nr:uncharacterized protein LOC131317047 [Rhododendron vialii]
MARGGGRGRGVARGARVQPPRAKRRTREPIQEAASAVEGRETPALQENFDGAQMMRAFTQALQRMANTTPQRAQQSLPAEPESRAISAMREFRRMTPPIFRGEPDPIAADSWLSKISKTLDTLQITEDGLRVSFAAYQLEDAAALWWESIENTGGVAGMTWATFKKIFLKKYFPEMVKDTLREEFLGLVQGNSTVMEYEARFTALSRFALETISTENLKARRFERGLNPDIRKGVVGHRYKKYSKVFECALALEGDAQCAKQIKEPKSQTVGFSFQPDSRKRGRETTNAIQGTESVKRAQSVGRSASGVFLCYHCNQPGHRKSECPLMNQSQSGGPRICHQCGQAGHIQRFCPNAQSSQRVIGSHQFRASQHTSGRQGYRPSQQSFSAQGSRATQGSKPTHSATTTPSVQQPKPGGQQGRVFTVAATTASESTGPSVVRGTFLFFHTWANVLIDTGASHSFISSAFATTLGLEIDLLSSFLSVDTPVGGRMILNRHIRLRSIVTEEGYQCALQMVIVFTFWKIERIVWSHLFTPCVVEESLVISFPSP